MEEKDYLSTRNIITLLLWPLKLGVVILGGFIVVALSLFIVFFDIRKIDGRTFIILPSSFKFIIPKKTRGRIVTFQRFVILPRKNSRSYHEIKKSFEKTDLFSRLLAKFGRRDFGKRYEEEILGDMLESLDQEQLRLKKKYDKTQKSKINTLKLKIVLLRFKIYFNLVVAFMNLIGDAVIEIVLPKKAN